MGDDMRVGIDGRYMQDHFPGVGRYTYNLVRALGCLEAEAEFVVFWNPALANSRYQVLSLSGPRVRLRAVPIPTRSWREQLFLPRVIQAEGIEVYHAPYYLKPYRLPCPSLVTIHDTSFSRYPEFAPSLKARLLYQLAMRLALATSTLVLTDSQASKGDLVRFFGVAQDKVRVLYPALSPPSPLTDDAEGIPPPWVAALQPYILYLGINKPHKNLGRLLRAYAQAQVEPRLVIAGKEDPRYPEARHLAASLGLGDRVRFLGEVAEAHLPALYLGAELFVFPSLSEGFGLPVLEAMSFGLPVVVSRASSLPEVVGEAGLLVDPLNSDDLASAMRRVLSDPALKAELARRARERAAQFQGERLAQEALALYREARSRG